MRYAAIQNGRIRIISKRHCSYNNLTTHYSEVVIIPEEYDSISSSDIIANYRFVNGKLKSKFDRKQASELKVAIVCNYGDKCGIATYSKFLYQELTPYFKDYKLFIEEQDQYDFNNSIIPIDKINICWKRNINLSKLVSEIKKYEPDIIFIQHEWGLFPNASYWLSMMTQLRDYRIITTLHSVFPSHYDKSIVEASIPEIVVHLDAAKQALQNKGISNKINVIPHGCFQCIDTKLWNIYQSNYTVIQFGFLFRYKSFETTIKAIKVIQSKYPNIFLTILGSTNKNSYKENELYSQNLLELVNNLNLEKNVAIITGFQSEKSLDSYLRCNKIAVFPYIENKDHICYGSSGAATIAMSKGMPIITSSVPHFYNLPSIKANTPEEIANELDKLFTNNELLKIQVEKQNQYLNENSWANIAKKYIDIL
jgi:glycosyltransferase involved in cell wall biosynthesis